MTICCAGERPGSRVPWAVGQADGARHVHGPAAGVVHVSDDDGLTRGRSMRAHRADVEAGRRGAPAADRHVQADTDTVHLGDAECAAAPADLGRLLYPDDAVVLTPGRVGRHPDRDHVHDRCPRRQRDRRMLHADPAGQFAACRPGVADELTAGNEGRIGVHGEARRGGLIILDEDPAVDDRTGWQVVDDVSQRPRVFRLRHGHVHEPDAERPVRGRRNGRAGRGGRAGHRAQAAHDPGDQSEHHEADRAAHVLPLVTGPGRAAARTAYDGGTRARTGSESPCRRR